MTTSDGARRTLFPYQEDALAYCMKTVHPALFMEMRLGKTLVTIRSILQKEETPTLVVAPVTVLQSWEEELEKEGQSYRLIRKKKDLQLANQPGEWTLTNYEFIRAHPGLAALEWGSVVFDESTKIKNPQAQITKLSTRSFKRVLGGRYLLTGMPAPEGPLNFFSQFQFQTGAFLGFKNYWSFRGALFMPTGYGGHDWQPKRETRQKVKEDVRRRAFCLTRKECKVGSKKIYTSRYVDATPDQRRLAKKAVEEYALDESDTKWGIVVQTWLAQIAGGFAEDKQVSNAKTSELLSLVKGELADQQVVVFYRFNRELNHCLLALKKAGVSCASITGEHSPEQRKLIRRDFQSNSIRVVLLQVKVARYGLDFSSASTVVYYSNAYSCEDRAQSEDRVVHPTKEEPLLYIDLITKGTVDEDVVTVLRDKRMEAQSFTQRLFAAFIRRTAA